MYRNLSIKKITLYSAYAGLLVWVILLGFDWISTYFEHQKQSAYEDVPFELKLKSEPEDVIYSEAFKTASGTDIVKYAYLAGEVSPILDEDISRRTPVSQTVVLETFKDDEDKEMEKLKTVFLSKPQFYQDDGQWRQIEYATTTPEIFAMSGAISHIKRRELVEKILPGKSVFAVTSTFYPNPNVETTSVDGDINTQGDSGGCEFTAWDEAQASVLGSPSDTGTQMYAHSQYEDFGDCTDQATISRAFVLFDTSTLGSTAIISAATLSVYIPTKYTGINDGVDVLYVDRVTPASNTVLASSDFVQVYSESQATTVDITSITTGSYTGLVLNSTGRSNISKTSITKFGIREGHDFEYNPPVPAFTGVAMYTADQTGTSQDPKLEVVYNDNFSFGFWFPF